jgi:outer membrane protein OmpA-like peptidoglycan-associated protein
MVNSGRLLIILLFFSVHSSYAQINLLLNGDFEEYKFCPKDLVKNKTSFPCQDWTSPNQGTPDYFNKCSKVLVGVPVNFAGVRNAFSGNGYSGIVCFLKGRDFKEYLQGKLIDPLQKDKRYVVSFQVSWATESSFMISDFGLRFSDSLIEVNNNKSLYDPYLSFKLNNSRKWESFVDTITARGGERFLVLGNFQTQEEINFSENRNKTGRLEQSPIVNAAYYYIDLVKVTELQQVKETGEFPLGKYFVGEGIYFPTDGYQLSDSSNTYLNRLVQFLMEHPQIKSRVEGHTDIYGSAEYNYLLSEKRANEVRMYLVSKGISKDRILIKGWGKDKPIDNRTEFQNLNRRIEILFE